MEFDDIYKYVGLFMVGLIVFWLALKSIRFQYRCVEGFIGKKPKVVAGAAVANEVAGAAVAGAAVAGAAVAGAAVAN